MSISREEIERGVLPSSESAKAMMMEKIRQDYRDAVAARLARRRSQPPYQLEIKGQGLDPTLMSLRGKEPHAERASGKGTHEGPCSSSRNSELRSQF